MVTQRMQQLQQAYKRWKDETSATDWFSMFRPLIHHILPDVSGNALKVYVFFCMNANPATGEARHSVKAVAQYLGKSERAVNDWIKELQEHGLIDRIQPTPNGEAHTYLLRKDDELPLPFGEAQINYSAFDPPQAGRPRVLLVGVNPSSNNDEHVPEIVGDVEIYFKTRFDPTNSLGQMIHAEREKRRMGLRELSQQTGMAMSYIVELELGYKTNPSLSTLVALSRALNVPIAYLLGELIFKSRDSKNWV